MSGTNRGFLFVRSTTVPNKVDVYQVDGNQGGAGYSLITDITVTAENRLTLWYSQLYSSTPSS